MSTDSGQREQAVVAQGLAAAARRAIAEGMPGWAPEGQLLRPMLAYRAARALGCPTGERFWDGALAIQFAHEASLLHDDVVDQSATRRGRATLQAAEGVATALLAGDHLLTASYRLAAATGVPAFMTAFAHAVERTVHGEQLQAQRRGAALSWDEYCEIVEGKSGELFALAAALPALLSGEPGDARAALAVGRHLGRVYQMMDDLLDYWPAAATGKPPFADYRRSLWTWPLAEVPGARFGLEPETVRTLLVTPRAPDGKVPLAAAVDRFREEASAVVAAWHVTFRDRGIEALLEGWTTRVAALAPVEPPAWLPAVSGGTTLVSAQDRHEYFAKHGRTFRFASRLFPPEARDRITGLYAFCRLTDDIADGEHGGTPEERLARLAEWEALVRRAWHGTASGVPLLDQLMRDSRAAGVPIAYPEALFAGARMDIPPRRYATFGDLAHYTYRVAGVVGCWITEWFGVHDGAVLDRAVALGHAMQLTNIARDVGEDLDRGRVYLPTTLLHAHGMDEGHLRAMRRGDRPVGADWVDTIEAVLAEADRHYRRAFPALEALPRPLARPVAVAARAYQGIHDAIRRNGHDTLTRRAATTRWDKIRLGAAGLWDLWRLAPGGHPPAAAQRAGA